MVKISEHEQAFRQGIHRGAMLAAKAIRDGATVEDLEAWLNGPLREWCAEREWKACGEPWPELSQKAVEKS